jgi:hypothetical protein
VILGSWTSRPLDASGIRFVTPATSQRIGMHQPDGLGEVRPLIFRDRSCGIHEAASLFTKISGLGLAPSLLSSVSHEDTYAG